jgi:hypothetical protein
MKVISTLILFLSVQLSYSSELILMLGGYHITDKENTTNNYYGIGYSFDNDYGVAIYKNSYKKTSTVVFKKIDITDKLNLTIGAVTGYYKSVIPIAQLGYDFPFIDKNQKIRITINGTISVNYVYKFDK